MRIASGYLLREFLLASGATLLAIGVTWIAGDTLLHIDELGEGRAWGLFDVGMRALDVLEWVVPMACAVGVVWSLTRAVRAREITAIRCGGIPLRRALAPILLSSLLIGLALGVFQDRVVIDARRAQATPANGESQGPQPVMRNGHWWYADARGVFSARDYDASSGTLVDVVYFEYGPGKRLARRIDAVSASYLEGNHWMLASALLREFDPEGVSSSEHDKFELDLGLAGADLANANRPLEHETLHGLAERLQQERTAGRPVAQLAAVFHQRLATPLLVLVLVLLAIPFAIGDVERGDSLPRALLASMIATTIFWLIWSMSLLAAQSEILPPALPIWAGTLTGLGIAALRFRAVRE